MMRRERRDKVCGQGRKSGFGHGHDGIAIERRWCFWKAILSLLLVMVVMVASATDGEDDEGCDEEEAQEAAACGDACYGWG